MSDSYDPQTGEVSERNGVASRAASAAAIAHVQMQRDRNAYGDQFIADAIARAIAKMPAWIKSEKEGARSKYAPLKDILAVVRAPLQEHGIRIRQGAERSWPADEGGGVKGRLVPVYTDLVHTVSGSYERTTIEIPLSRLDAQAMGSAITYGRRYTLLAALGLATDEADDDGAKAMPHDLHAPRTDSKLLLELQTEIAAANDLAALNKWGLDARTRKRIDQLSETEAERLRSSYSDRRAELSAAE